jgi:hypothetical protein
MSVLRETFGKEAVRREVILVIRWTELAQDPELKVGFAKQLRKVNINFFISVHHFSPSVRLPACLSVRPHEATPPPSDGTASDVAVLSGPQYVTTCSSAIWTTVRQHM